MPSQEMQAEMRIVAEIVAKPGKADALRAELTKMIAPSNAETGCRLYELHEDREQPGRFLFVERWAHTAAFDEHCRTPAFVRLGPAITELVATPPRLSKLKVIA